MDLPEKVIFEQNLMKIKMNKGAITDKGGKKDTGEQQMQRAWGRDMGEEVIFKK